MQGPPSHAIFAGREGVDGAQREKWPKIVLQCLPACCGVLKLRLWVLCLTAADLIISVFSKPHQFYDMHFFLFQCISLSPYLLSPAFEEESIISSVISAKIVRTCLPWKSSLLDLVLDRWLHWSADRPLSIANDCWCRALFSRLH